MALNTKVCIKASVRWALRSGCVVHINLPSDKNNVVLGNYLANHICMSQCSYINTNECDLIEEQMGWEGAIAKWKYCYKRISRNLQVVLLVLLRDVRICNIDFILITQTF